MKCYNCGKNLYSKYKYCPECGNLTGMCSKPIWAVTMSDSAQANRIEAKLDKLLGIKKQSWLDIEFDISELLEDKNE